MKARTGSSGASTPRPTERTFRSDAVAALPGLTVTLDDKKRFYANLRLARVQVTAELVLLKKRPFDAEPFNRTLDHLIENQDSIFAALRKQGFADYKANRSYIGSDWDIQDPARQLPAVKSVAEIERVIDFSKPEINLHPGFGNLSIRCKNTWDEGHRYTVVLAGFEISGSDALGEGVSYPWR